MSKNNLKKVRIQYYAFLREECGCSEESVQTQAQTPRELFEQIKKDHRLEISPAILKVAVNDEFSSWDAALKSNDKIMFIPPVAGG